MRPVSILQDPSPRAPADPTADPLGDAVRRDLRRALEAERAALVRRLADIQGGLSRVEHAAEQLAQDGDDAPQRDADREVDLARNDWTASTLGEVTEALGRIDGPDFGRCTDCGEAIALGRLRVEPWARRCTACQGRAESR